MCVVQALFGRDEDLYPMIFNCSFARQMETTLLTKTGEARKALLSC